MSRWLVSLLFLGWIPAEARTPLSPENPFTVPSQQPTVLIFTTFDCPVANKMVPEIRRIAKTYANRANLTLVYADPQTTQKELDTHRREYELTHLPFILDRQHQLVKAAGAKVTPEAVIVKHGKILYRGRINNFYEDFGKPRRVITQHDLRLALDAVLADQPVPAPGGKCIGCFIPNLE